MGREGDRKREGDVAIYLSVCSRTPCALIVGERAGTVGWRPEFRIPATLSHMG